MDDLKATENSELQFDLTEEAVQQGESEQVENKVCSDNSENMNSEEAWEKEKAELENQRADYYERLQRQQAEFDNYRKRTAKEKEELTKYASERIVVSMLPVVDNFERAITAAQTNPDFNAFAQGVELIFRQVLGTLDKEGLKPIEAVGQPFDPNLHEAVMQVDSEEYEENTVVEELQKGYLLKEKVIRPSMVKVAR